MPQKHETVARCLYQAFEEKFALQKAHLLCTSDVEEVIDGLWHLLGGCIMGQSVTQHAELLMHYASLLEPQIAQALLLVQPDKSQALCQEQATDICNRFIEDLPKIQEILFIDIRAAYEGDPAAVNEIETLLCYPGVRAITYQRIAHLLHQQGVRILPRIMTEHAHQLTGIDIHPGAQIGPAFFIDHGTGVVIGETCVIGSHVKLYQGVTLGAKSFPQDDKGNLIKGIKRHPNIGNNVIIYAETTILGNVTIGDGAIIGANKWITQDVPPHAKIN